PTQQVDEPGRDRQAGGVNLPPAASLLELTHGRDLVTLQRNIRDHRRSARTIAYQPTPQNHVIFNGHRRRSRGEEKHHCTSCRSHIALLQGCSSYTAAPSLAYRTRG